MIIFAVIQDEQGHQLDGFCYKKGISSNKLSVLHRECVFSNASFGCAVKIRGKKIRKK